jgi:ferredoxin-NADP reductase
MTGRDKWQYYTISNTGVVNTKLSIKVRGKNCVSEYGCDEIMDGDVVHVDGYNGHFRVTMYENGMFSYIPVL